MKLSDFDRGRDNNFNLIRISAALAVLVAHSFVLAKGNGEQELCRGTFGKSLGAIAVDVFFITSGFLVTASLLTRQSTIEFICARALRIFPALLTMLLLTVFVIGAVLTSVPLSSYFSDSRTYLYLAKCSTLINGVAHHLPGVFEANPYKDEVNGSLWTMPYEVRMYVKLALVWMILRLIPRYRLLAFKLVIVALAVYAGVKYLVSNLHGPIKDLSVRLSFMFFTGATFQILKEYIVLTSWLFWSFVIALALAAANSHAFPIIYMLTVAYVLLYVAYVPSGFIRNYNRIGDYSYGIYIYSFPMQQSLAALVSGVSVPVMILLPATVTSLLAALSWHLLERKALDFKGHCVSQAKRLLALTGKAPQPEPANAQSL